MVEQRRQRALDFCFWYRALFPFLLDHGPGLYPAPVRHSFHFLYLVPSHLERHRLSPFVVVVVLEMTPTAPS